MRKITLAFALLLTLLATTAFAGFVGTRSYFSDAAMTNQTGSEWLNCNGTSTWQGGTTSTYRRFEGLHCETANDVILCHQWNGTHWVSISCPY